jgi:hypothetical protein
MDADISLAALAQRVIEGTLTLGDLEQRLERHGYTHEQIDNVLVAIVQKRIELKTKRAKTEPLKPELVKPELVTPKPVIPLQQLRQDGEAAPADWLNWADDFQPERERWGDS